MDGQILAIRLPRRFLTDQEELIAAALETSIFALAEKSGADRLTEFICEKKEDKHA